MATERRIPEDPLSFIQQCVNARRVLWTYHVNMRLGARALTRDLILDTVEHYEIIEAYPQDRSLPAYLVSSRKGEFRFHVVFAADVAGETVRVVTAYRPDPERWHKDLRTRRTP